MINIHITVFRWRMKTTTTTVVQPNDVSIVQGCMPSLIRNRQAHNFTCSWPAAGNYEGWYIDIHIHIVIQWGTFISHLRVMLSVPWKISLCYYFFTTLLCACTVERFKDTVTFFTSWAVPAEIHWDTATYRYNWSFWIRKFTSK